MRGSLLAALAACALASACSGHGQAAKAAGHNPSGSRSPVTAPPADQVPTGFAPASATFISDKTGWVLGTVPCDVDKDGCDLVAMTRDAGRSWRVVGRPADTGGGELRFANARDGFLLGRGMSATHDGGRTWTYVDTLRDAIHEEESAEAARGLLWVTGRIDHGGRGLWVGSVRRSSFDFAPVTLPDGDLPDLMLSLHGPAVVLAYLDEGAPRLAVSEDGDVFAQRALPCAPSGPLALRTTREYVLACGAELRRTTDAGRSWQALTRPPAGGSPMLTPRSLFLAGDGGVLASRDQGRSWHRVLEAKVVSAGFESARLGFAIDDKGAMHVTRDDGRTWERVDFRRTR